MKHQRANDLLTRIYSGLRAFAMSHSRSTEQAKDFMQEGMIYAYEAIKKYPDKSDDELTRIIAKSANNRILTLQKESVTHTGRHVFGDDFEVFLAPDSPEEELEIKNFINVLRSRLPDTAKLILDERIEPSDKTLQVLEEETEEKMKAREQGILVMNIRDPKIQDVHISKALGISKATVCRNMNLIRLEAEALLNS